MTHCNCDPLKQTGKSKKGDDQTKMERRKKLHEEVEKKRNQHREAQQQQKKQEKEARSHMSKQEKETELATLTDKEESLEDKANTTFQQLAQLPEPMRSLFNSLSLRFNEELKECKNDPKKIDEMVNDMQDLQGDLEFVKSKIETAFKKALQGQNVEDEFDFDDIGLHATIGEAIVPLVILSEKGEFKEAENGNRPINPNNLQGQDKKIYDQIVSKYTLAKEDVNVFFSYATLETTKNLLKATNAQLVLLKNIQQQHELKEEIK